MASVNTRQRLLSAAENLFAERGFERVSVREITTAAGANVAAVNYYFGSKVGLIRALVDFHIGSLNQERLEMLAAAQQSAHGEPLPLEQILDIFFRPPVFRFVGADKHFPGLLGRLHNTTDPDLTAAMVKVFGELAENFYLAISRALPNLEPTVLLTRIHFLVGALIHSVSDCQTVTQALTNNALPDPDPEFLCRELVQFCAAGLSHE